MTRLKLLITMLGIGMLGLAGAAFDGAAHASTSSTVVSTKSTSIGTILVTSSGKTLYIDSADKPPHFACTGACLKTWPPLKAIGSVKAAGAAKSSLLGTTKGPGGKTVTYGGHPLYTYLSDTKSLPLSGQGQHGFYVLSPTASKITKAVPKKFPGGQVPGY